MTLKSWSSVQTVAGCSGCCRRERARTQTPPPRRWTISRPGIGNAYAPHQLRLFCFARRTFPFKLHFRLKSRGKRLKTFKNNEKICVSAKKGQNLFNDNFSYFEVPYPKKSSRGKNFRLRPRTPVRKLAKRNVGDVAAPSTTEGKVPKTRLKENAVITHFEKQFWKNLSRERKWR